MQQEDSSPVNLTQLRVVYADDQHSLPESIPPITKIKLVMKSHYYIINNFKVDCIMHNISIKIPGKLCTSYSAP
jgi:hypothetical protein